MNDDIAERVSRIDLAVYELGKIVSFATALLITFAVYTQLYDWLTFFGVFDNMQLSPLGHRRLPYNVAILVAVVVGWIFWRLFQRHFSRPNSN